MDGFNSSNASAAGSTSTGPTESAGNFEPTPDQNVLGEPGYPNGAKFTVALALIVFICMISLLFYRSLTVPEPSGFLLVQGEEMHNGLTVDVSPRSGGGDGQEHFANADGSQTATLNPGNRYTARFPLPPGAYQLRIRRGDTVLFRSYAQLREGAGSLFDLNTIPETRSFSTTAPAALIPPAPTFEPIPPSPIQAP